MDGKLLEELARISYQCATDYSAPLTGYKFVPFEAAKHKDVHRMVAREVARRVLEEAARTLEGKFFYKDESQQVLCPIIYRDAAKIVRSLAESR